MTTSLSRAWVYGFGVLIAAHALWFAFLQARQFSEVALIVLWLSPAVASFITAYCAPRKKFLLGVSLAVPTAVLVGILNFMYASFGNAVDFSGASGSVLLSVITLLGAAVICAVGSVVGYLVTRKSQLISP